MDPHDDPEARIRELEQPLADAARASELGTGRDARRTPPPPPPPPTQPLAYGASFPPPPPGPPAPWPADTEPYPTPEPYRSGSGRFMLISLAAVVAFLVAGGIAAYTMFSGTDSTEDGVSNANSSPAVAPPTRRTLSQTATATATAPGDTVIISGINENRTIECNANTITVSGIENTVEITGNCAGVVVSGIQNVITVESADTIGVSGFENRVTYHSGRPEVANSGQSNVVEQS